MDTIGGISNGGIMNSRFDSPVLFYSLFCSIYHHLYGLPKLKAARKPFKEAQFPKVWTALESVDSILKQEELTSDETIFRDSLKRHTTDEVERVARTEFLAKLIGKRL
jgi:hypothetical protein